MRIASGGTRLSEIAGIAHTSALAVAGPTPRAGLLRIAIGLTALPIEALVTHTGTLAGASS